MTHFFQKRVPAAWGSQVTSKKSISAIWMRSRITAFLHFSVTLVQVLLFFHAYLLLSTRREQVEVKEGYKKLVLLSSALQA